MATVVDPAREERFQIIARSLLEGSAQIFSCGDRALVRFVVRTNAAKERLISQPRAQHVQHPRALLIIVRVEKVEELLSVAIDDGRALLLLVREDSRRRILHVSLKNVFAFV